MAVSAVLLTSGSVLAAGDLVTASISPSGPVIFGAAIGEGAIIAEPAIAGCGLTWTPLGSVPDGTSFRRLFLWLGTGTPTPGPITVSEAGGAWDWKAWGAVQINGATPAVVVPANTFGSQGAAGVGDTVTYPQAMAAGNGGLAFFFSTGLATATPRAGWTELFEGPGISGEVTLAGIWRPDPDTIAAVGFSGGSSFYGACVELEAAAVDSTAPTLSSPTAAAAGQTSGSGSVSTDEDNGTLSWVVTTSSTPPSATQVRAGQNHTGAAAADAGSQAVSGTGVQNIAGGFSGLAAGTTYYAHYQHRDAAGNDSVVSTSAGFTTDPTNIAPDTPSISVGSITTASAQLTSSAFSDPDGVGHAESQWQVALNADVGFASPVVNVTSAVDLTTRAVSGLNPATAYRARVRHRDNSGESATEWSAWSTAATFMTEAVVGDAPVVAITAPTASAVTVPAGTQIVVEFSATDVDDGDLTASCVVSSSNSEDGTAGVLGMGSPVTIDTAGWSAGARTISVTATDADDNETSASFTLTIGAGGGGGFSTARFIISALGGF